ncbi:hypothetical protein C0581_02980 [Candidatus Parcubacteria bacterium]|nr:MAG: hypothetical protein C0581_02980 [Candidatus Parcubacteria bacterium]
METLTIVLPVHNEKDTIEHVLREWTEMLQSHDDIQNQFIICEDGSTDGTKELLKKIKDKYNLILNQKEGRRGYGGAVMDGIKDATSTYILSLDSDGQCDPNDFSKFWKRRDEADIAIGWRVNRADSIHRKIYSKSFKTFFKMLFPNKLHDPSAPFVLYKKSTIFPHLDQLTYLKEGFWWGFIGMAVKNNLSLLELPINHKLRHSGETQVYHFKKITSIAYRNLKGLVKLKFSKN